MATKLRALSLLESADKLTAVERPTVRIASPLADRRLNRPVIEAIFGDGAAPLSRSDAMTVPAVAKARALIVGQVARLPLRTLEGTNVVEQAPWLFRTDGAISPWHRMAWTVDDIMFTGWSVWAVERNDEGQVDRAERVPIEDWAFGPDGVLLVDEQEVDQDSVIIIPGPSEGFLEFAQRSLRGARQIEEAWVKRSKQPVPVVELHVTDETRSMTDAEVVQVIDDYLDARDDVNGLVAMTPSWVELKTHGEQAQVAIEARNFARVDVASFFNLPAAALDGSLSTASLTYSTQEGQRNEVADYGLAYWSDPIAARFSQDDCTPPGTRVRFDFSDLRTTTPSPTGPTVED